jgi:hypothetical protein
MEVSFLVNSLSLFLSPFALALLLADAGLVATELGTLQGSACA